MLKSFKKNVESALKGLITETLKFNANSTGCGFIYQPKAPEALLKFKRENRK